MRNFQKIILLAGALAAETCLAAPVLADPLEELTNIFEKQNVQQASLLSQQLGIAKLQKAMEKQGFSFSLSGAVSSQDAAVFTGLSPEECPGGYAEISGSVDPQQKQWQFDFDMGSEEASVFEMLLYGNKEKLTLKLPGFFDGAVGIRSGNFQEQYEGSALEQLFGELPELPEINLDFYPDQMLPNQKELLKNLDLTSRLPEFYQAEKVQEEGQTVYELTVQTEDLAEIYEVLLAEYFTLVEEVFPLSPEDFFYMEQAAEQMASETAGALCETLGEEILLKFYVKDEGIERIWYRLEFQEPEAEDSSCSQDSSLTELEAASDSYENAEPETVAAEYQIIFEDPKDPWRVFDLRMEIEDSSDPVSVWITKQTEQTPDGFETTITLMVREDGYLAYWDTPVTVSYEKEEQRLSAVLSLGEDEDEALLKLDGSFTDIQPGQGFTFQADGLTLEAEGEKAGITGSFSLYADPETSSFSEEKMILELNPGELLQLFNEVTVNTHNWMNRMGLITETE